MAEISIALNAAATPTRVSAPSNEHHPGEGERLDAASPAPLSFAAVLKSISEKIPPESGNDSLSIAGQEVSTDISDNLVTSPLVLLSLLRTDPSLPANPQQASLAPATDQSELAVEASTSVTPSADESRVTRSIGALLLPVTGAISPALANVPAPTFPSKGMDDLSEPTPTGAAGRATVHSSTQDELAVEPAIAATSAMTTTPISQDQKEGELRVITERPQHNPSDVVMLVNRTSEPIAHSSEFQLKAPLGLPGWHEEVGEKLTWMVSNNRQQADLVLNPSHLGRIEVTLTLDGDRASVSFAAHNLAVRETLENSLVRLREVFAEAGIVLGQTHVGSESRHDSSSKNERDDGRSSTNIADEHHTSTFDTPSRSFEWVPGVGHGFVDVFA